MTDPIACLGAGRMGRGIAIVFAYAGHPVSLIDFKQRDAASFAALAEEARTEITATLQMMSRFGMFDTALVPDIAARIQVVPEAEAASALASAAVVFEGFPEVPALKREALARAEGLMAPDAILASTTSTILVDDLSPALARPGQFLNAHWLNPAFLVPLVELSPGAATRPEVTAQLSALLEGIGKVPVTCAASPGYMIPRIQQVAMNEAARMVEEGVASAEDLEKAIRYGFSFRFSVLGLLEFIDWGGGDILFYASEYLSKALENDRYAAPEVIRANMEQGRIGLKTRQGFLNYADMDVDAYREDRLRALAGRLAAEGLMVPPVV
ncbi:3-hydroxybutyryl-CoA dehydrogenase [Pseudooceanicola algae]|uniref:L-gulonate 3-dehydrogenase n=1 Tax=Pseudooceanicola algae TaxID=1537215 RepID=A0A418SD74_9RHOB|nr:3-hydroxybutyryl-CoA dehydrogenase [Pseudooceanicola algae]QPM92342.1 3-hydroxybutyryl-CoA dehydrogenase [Pseudooceanicola algae]